MTALPHLAIGLMSGTSGDGVDAALVETDGERVTATGAALEHPYEAGLGGRLRDVLHGRGDIAALERDLTCAHVEAVQALLDTAEVKASDVACIGFPGQTVIHRPEEGYSWQIGNPSLLAEHTGIAVISDFRRRDLALGGQGAPLVPLFHAALAAQTPGLSYPMAVVNIGGVANITYIPRPGETAALLACDTGPGNALLNDWAAQHTGHPMDENGALAAEGTVDEAVLEAYLDNPFFSLPPPKSLDRNYFPIAPVEHLSPTDGAATLTAFTAQALALVRAHLPEPPAQWVICGGGRRNPVMMRMLREALQDSPACGGVEEARGACPVGDSVGADGALHPAGNTRRPPLFPIPQETPPLTPPAGGGGGIRASDRREARKYTPLHRRRNRLGRGPAGGAGVCVSGGARPAASAVDAAGHDRRQPSGDGRGFLSGCDRLPPDPVNSPSRALI